MPLCIAYRDYSLGVTGFFYLMNDCNCPDQKRESLLKHSLIDAGKSIIKHFTNSSYDAFVSYEEKERRLKICEECENKIEFFGKKQCKICLCFINPKSSLKDQDCPHPEGNKWQRN